MKITEHIVCLFVHAFNSLEAAFDIRKDFLTVYRLVGSITVPLVRLTLGYPIAEVRRAREHHHQIIFVGPQRSERRGNDALGVKYSIFDGLDYFLYLNKVRALVPRNVAASI